MKNKDSVCVRVYVCVSEGKTEVDKRDRGVYGVKYRVLRDKKSWMGCEKVMKRQSEKTQKSANLIDKHKHFPSLSTGAVFTAN